MNSQASTAASPADPGVDVLQALSGAEDLLSQAAAAGADKATELRDRALAQLEALHERLTLAQDVALETSRRAGRATDVYVHENPWRSMAVAAAVGLLVGLLINRR